MGSYRSCFYLLVTIALLVSADEKKTTHKKTETTKTAEAAETTLHTVKQANTTQATSTWFPNIDVLLKPAEDIAADLVRWKIIPDLLDEAPKLPMQAWWFEGPEATFGNEINDQNIVNEEPFWLEWKAENNTYYTVLLVGIDEKCKRHTMNKEKQYWIIGNIREYDFIAGEYLTEYLGPDPPEGRGAHRYVFLVYKQPEKVAFNEPKIASTQDANQRTNFSSRLFAKKYNLGKPIAVNFFRTRNIAYS